MIKLYNGGAFILNGAEIVTEEASVKQKTGRQITKEEAAKGTMAYQILKRHTIGADMEKLRIKFDCMASHDITYVGIIQTARASGLTEFPIPYVLTNCHNSLCAVGGTINEDDHLFGLSSAKKYGGIYVPAHQAVIHQYMREMMSGVGKMILGSDSHTRYGALGTMAIGEGGPELVKQLLGKTYDIDRPGVVAVVLTGKPRRGVGPQDVALALIGKVFENGYVKNKVMEFIGDGIDSLSIDYRNGIDVMTTETTCLSSVWKTDSKVKQWYEIHNREEEFYEQHPEEIAYYDGVIQVELDKIEPMIAMPFHPSNVFRIQELNNNLKDILSEIEKNGRKQLGNDSVTFSLQDKVKDGRLQVEQGVIAGCAGGTYENICDARDILQGHTIGSGEFSFSVYPSSQPVLMSLVENGSVADLLVSGAVVRSAFCGPCFGAGDVPANGCLSIRHSTRNFPNREGSKITNRQIASVALMDARSIAATAVNQGRLTAATELEFSYTSPHYYFHKEIYDNRCYFGYQHAQPETELKFGPNITDWPNMEAMPENILLKVVSVIMDPVTTTDELIPSGETSSYRSNPLGLAEFTLSRKDPAYVGRAKEVHRAEKARLAGENPVEALEELASVLEAVKTEFPKASLENTGIGSTIYAVKPGDGSAREQAASCQRVLGGMANIASEYATKRYRSNLINWGMLPFILQDEIPFENGDYIFIPEIREAVADKKIEISAYVLKNGKAEPFTMKLGALTEDERQIILDGCLINFYRTKA